MRPSARDTTGDRARVEPFPTAPRFRKPERTPLVRALAWILVPLLCVRSNRPQDGYKHRDTDDGRLGSNCINL
jgi:hypothetical protein